METQTVETITFLAQYAHIRILQNIYLRNVGFLVIIFSSWVREGQQGI